MSGFRLKWLTFLMLALCGQSAAEPLDKARIDQITDQIMTQFQVPGIALGIVKDGQVVYARGYGVRELGDPAPVDEHTIFKIASNSKALTSAALAILVDAGTISWDDPVIDHLPDFRLYDPWVTREFTILDLLTHRSGLGVGAGDLMLWPEPNSFSRNDIVRALRYFKPASSFRSRYAYDNLLYIVAGEVLAAASNSSWEDFVDQRLIGALGMERCYAGRIPDREMHNLAAPHGLVEDQLKVIERSRIVQEVVVSAAAGGIRCSLSAMLIWIKAQLALGSSKSGQQIWSVEQAQKMWTPFTIRSVSSKAQERDGTHFKAYGLGWRLADKHGYKEVAHTGSLAGVRTNLVLIPEINLGVVVLTNGSSSPARRALMRSVVRPYLGVDGVDWIAEETIKDLAAPSDDIEPEEKIIDHLSGAVLAPLSAYVGNYQDPWFGKVSIYLEDQALWFAASKSPLLKGRLWPHRGNTFFARWTDRTLEGDAFVTFGGDEPGAPDKIMMRRAYQHSDSSFNYQDLDLRRIQAN